MMPLVRAIMYVLIAFVTVDLCKEITCAVILPNNFSTYSSPGVKGPSIAF